MRSIVGGVPYESVPWDELLTLRKKAFELDAAKRNSAEKDGRLAALYEVAGVDAIEGGPLVLQETIAELRRKAALLDAAIERLKQDERDFDRESIEASINGDTEATDWYRGRADQSTNALSYLGVEPTEGR